MNKPTTFAELLKETRSIFTNGHTFEQYQNWKEYVLNNETELKQVIGKETIPSLNRFAWKDKKEKMVSSVYSTICSSLTFGDSVQWSPFDETFPQALRRITDTYTEEKYLAYKNQLQTEREAKEKALNNPETIAEFSQFISRKGEAALTQEQREKYDELTADSRKKQKEINEQRAATVQQVENVNAEMVIKESYHAKKNIPLWVVVLTARVERETYNELNNRAKKLGGYYSSYKGQGAIPGFTFESKEAAELFAEVKNTDVDASELKQQVKEEKQQTRAEALRDKGEKMEEEGNEELNRDRKDNTHRRAAMAASAENKAAAKVAFGKTLQQIANAMEAGEIKYLDKVSNAKDLEELNSILSSAKYQHIRAENLRSDNYEINNQTVNFAAIPYPVVYTSNSGEIMRMKDTAGKKLAAARMLKRLQGVESYTVQGAAALEDYETLFCTPCSIIDRWRIDRYKEQLMKLKRVQRMGIDSPQELRAALRELLKLKEGATISPEQKKAQEIREIERKFIAAKIPGFFPTPENLANEIVSLAHIKDGETILEPSAGLGHLAEAITAAHPENYLQCVEYNSRLAEAVKLKGFEVENMDFLEYDKKHDVIIMNPPFENLQDVEHVYHAFNLLNPCGRVVAIMANNKHRKPDFLQFVEKYGYMQENPAGSFENAFNSTGVSTITVYLEKPE